VWAGAWIERPAHKRDRSLRALVSPGRDASGQLLDRQERLSTFSNTCTSCGQERTNPARPPVASANPLEREAVGVLRSPASRRPRREARSRFTSWSACLRAVVTRLTTARQIRTGRTGRMTTSSRAASARLQCCSQASCSCTSLGRSEDVNHPCKSAVFDDNSGASRATGARALRSSSARL
jgi:hypothetical protein